MALRDRYNTFKALRERYGFKDKEHQLPLFLHHAKRSLYVAAFFSLWLFFIFFCFSPANTTTSHVISSSPIANGVIRSDNAAANCPADIARFYIYDLPSKFNHDLLARCSTLSIFTDMCPHVSNRGLGRPLIGQGASAWYATHQFIAEMIFHARADRHPCRTFDPLEANLFYVPFYGGLYASSMFGEPDPDARDILAGDLAGHLTGQQMWRPHHGGDHFLALGRTAWDFMRSDNSPDFGANRLLLLPAIKNMSVLTVERQPWEGGNQYGIPYPSYFHPYTAEEVGRWQEEVREHPRAHLFAFVGGPRKGVEKAAVRSEILRQCSASARCRMVECEAGSASCHDPERVMEVMKGSEFCMQPPGDSFTRRSVFDAVLAGCIPVYFSEHTAYTQYGWYLPPESGDYSVQLPKESWGSIEEELDRIPRDVVEGLRSRVISLIPSVTYAHPNATDTGFRDAVDVALAQLTRHVRQKYAPIPSVGVE